MNEKPTFKREWRNQRGPFRLITRSIGTKNPLVSVRGTRPAGQGNYNKCHIVPDGVPIGVCDGQVFVIVVDGRLGAGHNYACLMWDKMKCGSIKKVNNIVTGNLHLILKVGS